jgi:two-component system invasion response regulator UvrY
MLRILLVDDHDALRRALQNIVRSAIGETVFGEARSARQALDLCRREPWDLVVLDLSLPDRSGLAILKKLKALCRDVPVLVLSMFSEPLYVFFALKFGAMGYVTKQGATEELVEAIRELLSGRKYVSPSVAERSGYRSSGEPSGLPHEALTKREFEVLLHLASGLSLADTAAELSLSPKTLGAYRARLFKKMKLKTNSELAQYAARHGLIAEPAVLQDVSQIPT